MKNDSLKKIFSFRTTGFLFGLGFLFAPFFLSAREIIPKSTTPSPVRNIVVAPIFNLTNLANTDALIKAVEENILFTISLSQNLNIIDRSDDNSFFFDSPEPPEELLTEIIEGTNSHYILYGIISQTDSEYLLSLYLYNTGTQEVETGKEDSFTSIPELFTISEEMTESIRKEITGKTFEKGKILFINNSPGIAYTVSISNGKFKKDFGTDISSVILPEGNYTIFIYNPSISREKEILKEDVIVIDGRTQRFVFNLSSDDPKEPSRFNRKNTIRIGTGAGFLLGDQNISSTRNTRLTGWIADFPEIYYSRMFSQNIGIITGAALFPSLNFDSAGFKIKAGPYFRFGRFAFSPILGYGFVYSSSENHSLETFLQNTEVPENGSDYLISWGEIIIFIEIFCSPGFSIYTEAGFTVGYIEDHRGDNLNRGIDKGIYSGLGTGITLSTGVGISF